MKVLIAACTWRRGGLLPLFVRQSRLAAEKAKGEFPDLQVQILLCGSEDEAAEDAARLECHYVHAQNKPLGNKWIGAWQEAAEHSPDWMIWTGDDDLVCENWLLPMLRKASEPDVHRVGWGDFFYMNAFRQKPSMYYWPGYERVGNAKRAGETVGCGRMLSRKLLDAMGWVPFGSGHQASLDHKMNQHIARVAPWAEEHVLWCKEEGVYMVDVKTSGSVTTAGRLLKRNVRKTLLSSCPGFVVEAAELVMDGS